MIPIVFIASIVCTQVCLAQPNYVDTAAASEYEVDRPENEESEEGPSVSPGVAHETLVFKSGDEVKRTRNLNAAFLSVLVPGWGEYAAGSQKLGKSLMVLDGLFWIGLGSALFSRYLTQQDLKAYLYAYAGCDGRHGESRRTAWDLNEWELELPLYIDSSFIYDERIFKPSRDESMSKIDFYWQWESEEAHQEYYDLWKNASQAKVIGYYFLAGALVSRAVSFIHARYLLKKSNIEETQTVSELFHPRFSFDRGGAPVVSFSLHF